VVDKVLLKVPLVKGLGALMSKEN